MANRFNIEVTEKDIERAHRNDSYKCVVAQAIARTVPDATRIDVDSQSIRFTRGDQRLIYLTPYAVQGYVIGFDAGDPIEPFRFQLRNPIIGRKQSRTPAGKAADAAGRRVRDRSLRASDPTTDMQQVREAAKAAYDEARASNPGPTVIETGRRTPRVFKKKQRAYGHRLLRINRETTQG